jgi:hypothetical protein
VGREAEILVHGQRGEPDIDPVDEAQQVEQRQPPPGDGSYRRALDVFGHGCLPFARRSCCRDVWPAGWAEGRAIAALLPAVFLARPMRAALREK